MNEKNDFRAYMEASGIPIVEDFDTIKLSDKDISGIERGYMVLGTANDRLFANDGDSILRKISLLGAYIKNVALLKYGNGALNVARDVTEVYKDLDKKMGAIARYREASDVVTKLPISIPVIVNTKTGQKYSATAIFVAFNPDYFFHLIKRLDQSSTDDNKFVTRLTEELKEFQKIVENNYWYLKKDAIDIALLDYKKEQSIKDYIKTSANTVDNAYAAISKTHGTISSQYIHTQVFQKEYFEMEKHFKIHRPQVMPAINQCFEYCIAMMKVSIDLNLSLINLNSDAIGKCKDRIYKIIDMLDMS